MLNRLQRKTGCLLGLLAILMLTLAPAISQMLAASDRMAASSEAHTRAFDLALCSAQAAPERALLPAGSTHAASHGLFAHLQACGYCGFFAHTPALPTAQAMFVLTVRAIAHRVATRFESLRRAFALTTAQPRAPPLFS
jgi:Tfp pilus assembly protein PilX